ILAHVLRARRLMRRNGSRVPIQYSEKSRAVRAVVFALALLLGPSASAHTSRSANGSNPPKKAITAADVRQAEQRLADLGYWTGRVDGVWDSVSRQALIAFQKVEGRPPTGKLIPEELQ